MLTAKNGNLIVLNYLPVQSTADVEEKLNDKVDDKIKDETEKMGKANKYGANVDPTKDNTITIKE